MLSRCHLNEFLKIGVYNTLYAPIIIVHIIYHVFSFIQNYTGRSGTTLHHINVKYYYTPDAFFSINSLHLNVHLFYSK